MKKIILLSFLLLCMDGIKAQYCTSNDETKKSVGLFFQKSVPTDGITIQAGVVIDHIAVFAGFVQYKYTSAPGYDRTGCITLAFPYYILDKKVLIMPHFSAGLKNYQDIGITGGYDVPDYGTFCISYSRTMRLNASLFVNIGKK